MGTYAEFIAARDRDEQVLVWLEPRLVLEGWTLTPSQTNTYDVDMVAQVGAAQVAGGLYRKVVGVRENGDDLTERTSIATVEASASSWWWDPTAEKLYVHSSTGSDPDTFTTYQAIVRFHFATKPARPDLTSNPSDGSLYHHPWVAGGLPTLYERDDDDAIAAKLTRRTELELANGSGWWNAIIAHDGEYRWRNTRVRFKLGGSYDDGAEVLNLTEYADIATMLVVDATAAETAARFECQPLAGFLADQTLPSNPFFSTSYPNLGQGVSGTHEWIGYGRAVVLADLVDTVTSEGVWRTAEGVSGVYNVWAVDRSTGVRTLLNPGSPDVHYAGSDSIQILSSTYNWQTHWIEAEVEGRLAPNGNTFAPIAWDILTRYLGVASTELETASFFRAQDLAPQQLRVWFKAPRSVTSLLTTTQEGFPSLERSVLGRVGQTAAGLWSFGVTTPGYDASAIPELRVGDFARFEPVPASRQPVAAVNVYYNARHVADRSGKLATEWDVETVTGSAIGWENEVSGKTLDVHTFLVDEDDARILGERLLLLAGPQRAEVAVELTGTRAIDARIGDKLLVSYSPAPCVVGAYDRAAFDVIRVEHGVGPRARQTARLSNLRGLAHRAGRWQPDGLSDYASSTEFQRNHRGFWTNASDEAAAGDAASKRSRWW